MMGNTMVLLHHLAEVFSFSNLHESDGEILEQGAQGGSWVTIPGGVQEKGNVPLSDMV